MRIQNNHSSSRRQFLTVTAATVAASVITMREAHGDTPLAKPSGSGVLTARLTPEEFKKKLVGPIYSNPCPFKENFDLDDAALTKSIRRAIKSGIRVFACTAGNTQYAALNDEEVKHVNRMMVEAVNGEGVAIAATGDWWTGQAVEFARYAESIGADAIQVLLPSRANGDEATAKHVEAVARAVRLPLVLHGKYTVPMLKRLAQIDSVVGMKEDSTLNEMIDQQIAIGDRITIFGGGAEYRVLVGRPYGMHAFYSTYATFAPDVSMKFWNAVQSQDEKKAIEITLKYDYPFINRFSVGFWHASLEYFGIGTRYIRPPQESFTDKQMGDVKAFYDGQGLSPDAYN